MIWQGVEMTWDATPSVVPVVYMWRLPSSADLLSHEGRGLKVGLVFWEHEVEGEEAEEDSSVRISVICESACVI